ncbi:NADH-quinone oxidoreductase subunit NuoE [Notoacmeibacter sp. MSK16QG-6]|uniref:NADH-quinone oxidoreductase subunit NuoE n=1 Tax=Notoacmeibacter sp. MSK16QG-6 TaxID=2957982 RepID=UPI00209E4E25|nr:NADH-quinone oxidoreductase subunit NuoE [Notoacmeibacter sp. MSK16QG-6]MCP1197938.1 NADH-quinone oxidoreductase subunit NuoE [Notoacmeibacter sp. MSK16QG-6]
MSVRRLATDDVQPAAFSFDAARQSEVDKWLLRYPAGRQQSAVIPLLMLAQEQEGWVTKPAVESVAQMLGMPLIRVLEVATFYTQFMLAPVGTKAHIQVCGTTPCWLRGAGELIEHCKTHIHPDPLHPNADGTLSWEEVECQGACVNAPMVIIGKDAYEDLTVEKLDEIIKAFEAGQGADVPTGPQNGRIFSMAIEGATSLTDEDAITLKPDAKPQSGHGDQSASRRKAEVETAADTVAALARMIEADSTARPVAANQPSVEPGYGLTASGEPVATTGEAKIATDERLENPDLARESSDQAPSSSDVGAGTGKAAAMAEKMPEQPAEPAGGDKPTDAERAEMTKAAKPEGDAPEADQSIEGPADAEGPGHRDPAQQAAGGDKSDSSPSLSVAEGSETDEPTSSVEGEAKPELHETRPDDADDLGLISGIGPKIHGKLNDLGVYKFSQIAGWTPDNAAYVDRQLSFRGRIARERWIEQADALAAGGSDEYERRFGKKPR